MKNTYIKGFTLIELLIALSIAGLVLGVGIPSFSSYAANIKSKTLQQSIISTLNIARQQSLSYGKVVTVCSVDPQNYCTSETLQNLVVFIDENENYRLDETDNLIVYERFDTGETLDLKASRGSRYIHYTTFGTSKHSGSFIYCDKSHPMYSARIIFNMPGRAYISQNRADNGIVKDISGQPISC